MDAETFLGTKHNNKKPPVPLICVRQELFNSSEYCTSSSSDLEMLKPSSWLIIRLQRGFRPRPLMSSRDEAEAGKRKVMFLCNLKKNKVKMCSHLSIHRLCCGLGRVTWKRGSWLALYQLRQTSEASFLSEAWRKLRM